MKRCNHTRWLGICGRSGSPALVQSDRPAAIAASLPLPDTQRPSLFVLIGNAEKSLILHTLFGVKKSRTRLFKQHHGEVHLHLDPATTFTDRPILLVDCDVLYPIREVSAKQEKCHREERHVIRQQMPGGGANELLPLILFPLADVFCFFSDDMGGLRKVAQRLALWLNQSRSVACPMTALPRILIVTSKLPRGAEAEEGAKRDFLVMLEEETAVSPYLQLSAIDIVATLQKFAVSATARCGPVKDRLMENSDYVRKERRAHRALYSGTHTTAFLHSAATHFARSSHVPFNLIHASRAHNHITVDLIDHFSNFIKHTVSSTQLTEFTVPMLASTMLLDSYPPDAHIFDYKDVFHTLYRPALLQASDARVIALIETNNVILRSGFIRMVEMHLSNYFEQLLGGKPAATIHAENLARFQRWWPGIQSSSTCLCCLRRRPQYGLPCGHCLCENCVLVFADRSEEDPWNFEIHRCFLCEHTPATPVNVRIHPPTAGAGVMCIDGGGARGISALVLMKRIQDRIDLPIPLQRFVKVAFGVSIGAVIAIDHYINGRSLTDAIQMFPDLMERTFQRRVSLHIPILSRALELTASCLSDGLYSAGNLEAVIRGALGADKHILEPSYATSTGTRVGLPVATVSRHPSYRVFTNYNGVGTRPHEMAKSIVRPKDGAAQVPLWTIARAVTAAPGFFPPMHIKDIGTFQDAGPLENDPLLWALAEAAALFPHAGQPDFVVSLGTGEPSPSSYDVATSDCRSVRKNGMLCRIRDLLLEKTRDRVVQRACKSVAGKLLHRIHRLNVDFDGPEPRLDDTSMIPELTQKSQANFTLTPAIDIVARRMVASLFYFELDDLPQWCNGKYVLSGRVLCSVRRGDLALGELLRKLSNSGGRFLVGDWSVADASGVSCIGKDGNFGLAVDIEAKDKFAITLQLSDEEMGSHISGSPFFIHKLVAAQGLHAPFGRSDHRKRKRGICWDELSNKRRRIHHL